VKTSQIRKHFKEGNRVKVVSGTQEGETGFVVKVDQHDHLVLFTDKGKEVSFNDRFSEILSNL
jgi:transcription elongation factor SPT5